MMIFSCDGILDVCLEAYTRFEHHQHLVLHHVGLVWPELNGLDIASGYTFFLFFFLIQSEYTFCRVMEFV